MSEINNDSALDVFAHEIADLLAEARRQAARSVNAILTATYYEIGRRIVVFEQNGKARADYGDYVMERLYSELSRQFGRGFGRRNLETMRLFTSRGQLRRQCLRNSISPNSHGHSRFRGRITCAY